MSSPVTVAIIPIGGVGARLYPLTVDTSKSMIRFLNRPLLEFILETLIVSGVREVYMGVSGYVNYVQVFEHFGSGEALAHRFSLGRDQFRVRYMPNILSRGNAEAVLATIKYYSIRGDVLVTQCDTVFSHLDLSRAWYYYSGRNCDMLVVLKPVRDPGEITRYGVAKLREDGTIEYFVEKPKRPEEAPSNLVNTGIYLISAGRLLEFFESSVGAELYREGYVDFGRDVIPAMIKNEYRVCGYPEDMAWFDVGTPEAYLEAVFYLLKNTPQERLGVDFAYEGVRVMGRRTLSREFQRSLVERARSGVITLTGDVLIGRHCTVGDQVVIANSVIDHYSVVSSEARIEWSVVMDRCHVGRRARITRSIIGRHVIVDEEAVVEDSIIGNNVYIGRGAVIRNSKIWPSRYIPPGTVLVGVTLS
ncbi:MAG: NDP-sugar synthase [Desulfurococcaceae archaeon]|nr:NDP-sugar synthase [Desulfurococcaceae archaeon]